MHLGVRKSFTEEAFISSMEIKMRAKVWTFMKMSFHSSTFHKVSPLTRFSPHSNRAGERVRTSMTIHHFRSLRWTWGGTEPSPRTVKISRQRLRSYGPKVITLTSRISTDRYPKNNGTYEYWAATAFSTQCGFRMNEFSQSYLNVINRNLCEVYVPDTAFNSKHSI